MPTATMAPTRRNEPPTQDGQFGKECAGSVVDAVSHPEPDSPPRQMTIRIVQILGGFCCLWVLACGEREDGIESYRVPKDRAAPKAAAADPHAGMPAMPGSDPHAGLPAGDPHAGMPAQGQPMAPRLAGEVPADWVTAPGSAMRLASYRVTGDGGAVAEISAFALGGTGGGVLENVNRWRGQLGLDPVDQAGLEASRELLQTPVGEALVVDLQASEPVGDPTRDGRIVAAIVLRETDCWFYKMRGNAELAATHKAGFLRWVETARKLDPKDMPPPPSTPAATPPPAPAAAAGPPDGVRWQAPAEWKQLAAGRMISSKFQAGDAAVSVSRLGGDGGGELANVNRWRGQVGIEPVTLQDLEGMVETVPAGSGSISVVTLAGAEQRMIAGWTRRGDATWYFKLSGPAAAVEAEQDRFRNFLGSVEIDVK